MLANVEDLKARIAQLESYDRPREILTADRTLYVATTGSDANDGLSASTALQTLQAALTLIARRYDLAVRTVTIQLANGTYTAGGAIASLGHAGSIVIRGDTVTPANVVINPASGNCLYGYGLGRTTVYIQGLTLQNSVGGAAIYAEGGGLWQLSAIAFGAISSAAHIVSSGGADVRANGDYSITGGAARHWQCMAGGFINITGRTITLTGTPAFSSQFAIAYQCGVILCSGNTFSGAATGTRYSAQTNGVIETAGGGALYLPGNVGGAVLTGGQYN